jgi:hypothetical protein
MRKVAEGKFDPVAQLGALEKAARDLKVEQRRDRRHRYLAALGLALALSGTLWVMFGAGGVITLAGLSMNAVGIGLLIAGALRSA